MVTPVQAPPGSRAASAARRRVGVPVAIALVANYVGGGLLIGWYYAYCNDDRKYATSA